ncbi:hypothetical protein WJX77_002569 [Trebouxia sp. C0004]
MTNARAAELSDVLTPLLSWGLRTSALDALDVLTLLCVSREANLLIKWEDLARLSSSNPGFESKWEHRDAFCCEKCNRRTGPTHLPHRGSKVLCMHCQGVITTHSARTVYKLHQANIQHLAGVVVCTMKGCVVRWTIALDLRSVLSIALIKHGGPKQLRLAMTRPCSRVGDHCHKQVWRLEEVNKMVDKLDLSEQDKMLVKIPFPGTMQRIVKKKGAASVREACARMEQYERLMDTLPDRDKAIMKRADLRGIYLYADLIHQDWYNSFNQITHNLVATQESYDASTELLKMIAPINVDKLDGLRRKHHASTHLGNGLQALLTYLRPANKKAMRQRQLTEALSRHNLLPRSDSRLCRAYTNEEEPFPLEEISNMMQEMNWLVSQTTYQEEFASRIKQRANNSDAEYNRISKLAKRAALQVWTWKKSAIPADIRSRFEDSAFV